MSDSGSEGPAVVIDNGSGTCKAGLAGEEEPAIEIMSLVGRTKDQDLKEYYFGDEAWTRKENLNLRYPIEFDVITDWESMEKLWAHILQTELKINPENHPVMCTECPRNPKCNRERICEMMFEKFHTPAFYLAKEAVLSLYSHGITTGIVLDSGHGVTHMIPTYEGYALPHAFGKIDLAGRDLTNYMAKMLAEKGTSFCTSESAKHIKEKLCYTALDFETEMEKSAKSGLVDKTYELPDGSNIDVGKERFFIPELLFQPHLKGIEMPGIHQILHNSISKCDVDIQTKQLYSNIVLSGGTTLIPGLCERLHKEMTGLAPPGTKVKVIASPERKHSAWIGGSILASTTPFQCMWITKHDYDEYGPSIVHTKCY